MAIQAGVRGFLLVTQFFSLISSELYHIVPVSEIGSCQDYRKDTCFTLEKFRHQFKDGTIPGDNTIVFMNGNHILTWRMHFKGTGDATLRNSEQNDKNTTPVITCHANSGIDVNIVGNFTTQGLVFAGKEGAIFQSSLLNVIKAAHTTLTQSSFINIHSKVTVISIFHTALIISNSHFINNSAQHYGVLRISSKTQSCNIDKSEFRNNKGKFGGAINSVTYQMLFNITESIFINNSASKSGGAIYTQSPFYYSTKNMFEANSCGLHGGAVCIDILNPNNKIEIEFQENLFQNNSAQQGAALHLGRHIYKRVHVDREYQCLITSCNFSKNIATDPDYPSVVYPSVVYNTKLKLTLNGSTTFKGNFGSLLALTSEIALSGNVSFKNNTSVNGGAITLIRSSIKFGDTQGLTKVHITGNKASYGAGIYLEQSIMSRGYMLLTIVQNTAQYAGGGIYAIDSQINLNNAPNQGMIYVTDNLAEKGGGLYMAASILQSSISYFGVLNNTAYQYGGGAYLDRDSRIMVISEYWYAYTECNNFLLDFTGNLAIKGGGIFVADSINYPKLTCDRLFSQSRMENIAKQCFIQIVTLTKHLLKIGIIFNNNSAIEVGNDIYGGLLDRCTAFKHEYLPGKYNNKTGLQYLQATGGFGWANKTSYLKVCKLGKVGNIMRVLYGHVTNKTEFHNHISSDPMRVCFCVNGTVDCDYTHPTVFTKKGQEFTLSLAAVDQVEKPVNATLISSLLFENQGEGRLNQGQQSRKLPQQCMELKYNAFSSTTQAVLELYADGPCGDKGISKQQVNISFEPCTCPIGLEPYPPSNDCVCDCNKELTEIIDISNCSAVNGTIQLNKNIWIKYANDNAQFITYNCPFNYCKKKPFNVSLVNETETNKQCAFNRTGTLCGKCAKGLSMVLGTSKCQICSSYYLFLLLPFGLAGIALVAIILLLNMTVATGTIHGLIFYANILAANRSIFLPFTHNFLTVFISFLNLDLGMEMCFYNGMESYGKFLLQLVFPTYVFILIGIVMILCNRSERFAHLLSKRNPETTLYTLVLLSFSKLIQIIITSLQFAVVEFPNSQKILWLFDGNVEYLTLSHIPRFLVAILITMLGTVYIVLLLCGQAFNRCSNYYLMKWTTHRYYIHFMNAHNAPFANGHHRYWVGLLLLVRLVHYLISAFLPDTIVLLSLAILGLIIILYKQVNKNIYNSRWLDILESFFLFNLSILATATLYIKLTSTQGNQQILANISMAFAFLAFVFIVFYHAIVNVCGKKCSIRSLCSKLLRCFKKDYIELEEAAEDDDDKLLLEIDNRYNDEPASNNAHPIVQLVTDQYQRLSN